MMVQFHEEAARKTIEDSRFTSIEEDYSPFLAIWLLKMAICSGCCRKENVSELPEIFQNNNFITLTGIKLHFKTDSDGDNIYRSKEYAELTEQKLIKILESRLSNLSTQGVSTNLPLFNNIETLGKVIGLSQADKILVAFASALTVFKQFDDIASSQLRSLNAKAFMDSLSVTVGLTACELETTLAKNSTLMATGIMSIAEFGTNEHYQLLLGHKLDDLLFLPELNEANITQRFLKTTTQTELTLSAYAHLDKDIRAIAPYLTKAIQAKQPGTNILFYGVPGTGKTEMAKVVAALIHADLFEVPFSDEFQLPLNATVRLGNFNTCQRILASKPNALLLVDEVEDIFDRHVFFSHDFDGEKSTKKGKAWINQSLEQGTTPAIWITNDENIDPAYLRRFDYSIKFPVPPLKVRQQIARHHLGEFNPPEEWLTRIAANDQTTPAQYDRAAKVARLASDGDVNKAIKLVEQTLDRSSALLGQKQKPNRNMLRTGYDLRFIHADMAIPKLIDAMKQRPSGNFCFYGPPGTGKSELARHMADEIGQPFLLRRASDILSMWVGEAEKNIAAMFAEARDQDAVLLLDEADSFLADRRDAQRSWEVTQVNELLTQMEAHDGIFICTTNLMQRLDPASMRRFTFKIKFDFLTPDQSWAMFLQELTRMNADTSQAAERERYVRKLNNLTPGDFAVTSRQFNLLNETPTAAAMYGALLMECEAKEQTKKTMGFV